MIIVMPRAYAIPIVIFICVVGLIGIVIRVSNERHTVRAARQTNVFYGQEFMDYLRRSGDRALFAYPRTASCAATADKAIRGTLILYPKYIVFLPEGSTRAVEQTDATNLSDVFAKINDDVPSLSQPEICGAFLDKRSSFLALNQLIAPTNMASQLKTEGGESLTVSLLAPQNSGSLIASHVINLVATREFWKLLGTAHAEASEQIDKTL